MRGGGGRGGRSHGHFFARTIVTDSLVSFIYLFIYLFYTDRFMQHLLVHIFPILTAFNGNALGKESVSKFE